MHTIDIKINLDQISDLIDAGGPVVIILITMSIIGLAALLLKSWQFYNLKINKKDFIPAAIDSWSKNDKQAAQAILGQSKNPIARVLETAIHVCHKDKDLAVAREEVLRVATIQLANLRSHLRILEVIATLSPLLGLFGTVLGMIEAFHRLETAGTSVDPALLSGGIWEALLTTAAGLAVAIPAIIALNWLEQRIENFKLTMEDAMTQIFTRKVT